MYVDERYIKPLFLNKTNQDYLIDRKSTFMRNWGMYQPPKLTLIFLITPNLLINIHVSIKQKHLHIAQWIKF